MKPNDQARKTETTDKDLLVALPEIPVAPGYPRWRQAMRQAHTLITLVQDEMQSYHDERSERWQESDRADDFRDQIDSLSDIEQALTELLAP